MIRLIGFVAGLALVAAWAGAQLTPPGPLADRVGQLLAQLVQRGGAAVPSSSPWTDRAVPDDTGPDGAGTGASAAVRGASPAAEVPAAAAARGRPNPEDAPPEDDADGALAVPELPDSAAAARTGAAAGRPAPPAAGPAAGGEGEPAPSAPEPGLAPPGVPAFPRARQPATERVSDRPAWHAFWPAFHSRIAADGFAEQLERTTGLAYRVEPLARGRYRVAVAHRGAVDLARSLAAIENATGFALTDEAVR